MADQRRSSVRDLTVVWRVLSMVAIAGAILGTIYFFSESLLAMPSTGLLLVLVPVKRFLTGTVPAGRKRGKTW